MRVTVIVENHARTGLVSEHGWSVWVEMLAGNVLFDTGQGPAFPINSSALGIPLETAKAIVLSHGHYDHSGGLAHAVDKASSATLHLHPEACVARFSIRDNIPRYNGMPRSAKDVLQQAGDRVVWSRIAAEILPGLHVTGPIPRRTSFEDPGGPFFLDEQGLRADSIPDDQALWAETASGLVVLLGCAHSGVVNTLNAIREQSGQSRVYAVVGGMHLAIASRVRLEETAKALEDRKVQIVAPAHCTGKEAVRFLRERLPGRVVECTAGETLSFGGIEAERSSSAAERSMQ